MASAGAQLVLADDLPAEAMLREIRLIEPAAERSQPSHPLLAITGGAGAPGRTEVALALAWRRSGRGRCILVDADLEAPSLAVRLGVAPRPDLADAVDAVHIAGDLAPDLIHPAGRLGIVTGSHRPGEPPLRPEPVFDVVDAARTGATVVVDTGRWPLGAEIVKAATTAVVVADASPSGIVRGAALLAEWAGPPPVLVINRATTRVGDVVQAARRWTGLDPAAVIPFRRSIMATARRGGPPDRHVLRHLAGVTT
jgi:MinD-like ATPase involved in chromosome partitioning or flagellar assembly